MIEKELVIIGAGPAGLAAGEEAKRYKIDTLIIEKGRVGQAWREIRSNMPMLSPCHPQRDWTSISERFPIWKLDISRPFCTAGEFVHYLQEFSDSVNLDLKLHTKVLDISKTDENLFVIRMNKSQIRTKTVIVSTGFFGNPYIPDIEGFLNNKNVSHSHYYMSPEEYRQKRVAIIGGGNSAAEIAIEIAGYSQVFLLTRKPLRFFSKTQNLCDIRGVSESMLLELIRMGLIRHMPKIELLRLEDKRLYYKGGCLVADHIICATGYHPVLSVFNTIKPKTNPRTKFPHVSECNESHDVQNLFFAGPLAYKRSGSMFIHGFVKDIPVTVKAIHNRLRE